MKTTKLFLILFLITAFGTSEFFAQRVDTSAPTTKTKRKHTKKSDDSPETVVTANGPVTSVTNEVKPKRKYTRKTDLAVTPTISTTTNNSIIKPKRTYTRKTAVNAVAPTTSIVQTTTSSVQPATKYTQAVTPAKTALAHNTVKQAYHPSNGGDYNGHQVLVGPKGGKYYINKNGNKTYIK
ncbi:hypothetical protein [Kaistella jeonii]|uniref:PBCV-specific basic adaptor domain-containing protein n=1 Tax=Kaistella jeonii TaxID=266749 RepID=A0A0C1D513_9FLAO|nr:hypothetical protein [Kaistella jeonii]KIA88870.1 hypothetical protein OA86_09500 [Kaistella jeonii]SFC12703.1 hypothetical protein SAMN05421876_10729 [Kaistella jeonii]VEI94488.1 Uncharacterised protein [Kaistella jeonii]